MPPSGHGVDVPARFSLDLEEAEVWPAKVWNLQPPPGRQGPAQAGARSSTYKELRKCRDVNGGELPSVWEDLPITP